MRGPLRAAVVLTALIASVLFAGPALYALTCGMGMPGGKIVVE